MKVLASLAIAGAVLAMLAAMVLNGLELELTVLLALATAVFLFLQRTAPSVVAGALLSVVALVIAWPLASGISTQGGTFGDYLDFRYAHAFAVLLALFVAATPLLFWNECGPLWARLVGAVGLTLAAILTFVVVAGTDPLDQTTALGGLGGMAILTGLLALAGIVPAVFLIRDAGDTEAAGHPSSG